MPRLPPSQSCPTPPFQLPLSAEPAGLSRCRQEVGRAPILGLAIFVFAMTVAGRAFAGCDLPSPTTGQTTTCSPAAPNPDTTGVAALGGSTNVTVNVQPGATINVNNGSSGVTIRDASQVSNQGTITQASPGPDGITITGNGNTATNTGTISTTTFQSDGIFDNGGSNNRLVNDTTGTI